jgi:uroporphyrinogen III methyltransferase/synthase
MSARAAYRVLYTRPEPAHAFEARLRSAGCALLRIPLIRIAAPASWDALDAALARISDYDGVLLTSTQAVRWFTGRLVDCGIEHRSLPPVHAVGPKTAAAAKDIGLAVEQLPSAFYGATMAAEMKDVEGKRYLQPTSDIARDELVRVLAERGARVEQVAAYRTLPASDDDIRRLREAAEVGFDCAAFFSPSAVRQFRAALPNWRQGATYVAVIGATTAAEAERTGLRVDIVAAQQTAESLADAIAAAMNGK